MRPGNRKLLTPFSLTHKDCLIGPYINAETTAGGIAHWVTTEVAGTLRTNATDYTAAWQDYITGIAKSIAPNQITNGGPVIGVLALLPLLLNAN